MYHKIYSFKVYNPVGFSISTCSFVWIYHIIVLIDLSVDENLNYFHSLAMNVGVRNNCVHFFE